MSFSVRRYVPSDRDAVWALNHIPFKGASADPSYPLDLPVPDGPGRMPDLANVLETFVGVGGEFLVVEMDARVVGMGGFRENDRGQADILRVRVHPAVRRQGVGRMLMESLHRRALESGFSEAHLDTTVEQPEAMAFYESLGYREIGRERFPAWELVYYLKEL